MKRLITLAALLGTATVVGSYTYTYSPPAKWGPFPIPSASGEVVWLINDAGTPDYAGGPATGDGEVVFIKAALLDWEDSTAGNLDLEYGGGTPADATYGDGINAIFWDEAWTTPAGVMGLGGSMVGGSGSIIEGNVELNGTASWSSASLIEGISLHELGHSLGLGHTSTSGAVMAPVFTGELDPQPDDIAGMVGLYGTGSGSDGVDSPGGPPPPPPPPPPGPPPAPPGSPSTSSNDSGGSACGLTGLEYPVLFGLWCMARRASRRRRH
ncbi:MAG: peptidase M10A and M12B matrixin and [Planctomycetota bacterium]|nr:MAG: peptidase M10A and M12B matrixin and [Planctomycetota bacterium]